MTDRLTDATIKRLPAPATGNKVYFDSEIRGFGIRVTAAGARSFILNYRNRSGRERRFTIGSFPDWRCTAARGEAKRLKAAKLGQMGPIRSKAYRRPAASLPSKDMVERYIEEHLPKKRPNSQADDRSIINQWIKANGLRHAKVAEVTADDIDALHRKITKAGTPYRANRVVSCLSKMFSLAIRWRWRLDNPCHGVERNPENKRKRYLTAAEIERLTAALAAYEDQSRGQLQFAFCF